MFSGREKKRDLTEHRKAQRRAVQARHRATLAGLFESLKNVVCPSTQRTPAKWKILDHAKGFLLEKEAYLRQLLALKEVFLSDSEGPKTLEEVQEEYRKLYSECFCRTRVPDVDEGSDSSEEDCDDEEMDESSQSESSGPPVPNIQEFEGYLCFYRQTLELLLRSGVLAPYQTGLPVVSQAISGLWKVLPPDQRAAIQRHTLDESPISGARPVNKPAVSPLDFQLPSLSAYGPSAFEADLLQDVYDVVQRDMDAMSGNRPVLLQLQSDDYKRLGEIYKDIKGFVKSHTPHEEELSQACKPAYYLKNLLFVLASVLSCVSDWYPCADNEEVFLRCSESFDEDF